MSSVPQTSENFDTVHVPTLNIQEAVCRFRAAGISTSTEKLGAGLEQGKYPFGICIKSTTKRGDPCNRYEIYEKLLEKYLDERAT